MTLPSGLPADCTGSLGVQITNFAVPAVDDVAHKTTLIYNELQMFKKQVSV